MTCLRCTCHEIPTFVVFLPYFKLLQIINQVRQLAIFFVLSSSSSENLIPEKLGICNHVLRPVSQERRMLVMEMEVGKAVYLAYNTFATNILTQFLYYK